MALRSVVNVLSGFNELVVEFHQFLSHNLLNLTACPDKKISVCL